MGGWIGGGVRSVQTLIEVLSSENSELSKILCFLLGVGQNITPHAALIARYKWFLYLFLPFHCSWWCMCVCVCECVFACVCGYFT